MDLLRSGAWVTRERMRMVAGLLAIAGFMGIVFLVATSDGRNDRFNRPLGTDFSNVYAAGTYVLDGQPAAPFDMARQHAREQTIFGKDTPVYGWHYPPYFLGLAGLLAAMPYALALALWQGVTLVLYAVAMRAVVRSPPAQDVPGGDWLLLALAFPAVFINLGHGHNGFLTAALFAGGLVLLERRPWLAGLLLGLLAYKPQFGLLIPLALACGGYWRAFASAALTVAVLTIAVTLTFGADVWTAFLAGTEFTRTVILERGDTGWHKIQSVFSVVRMWGGPVPLAYAAQFAITLIAVAAIAGLWRSRSPFAVKAAALLIATVLATPYSLDYDLMLLAPAIAWFALDGMTRGFSPYEKSMLALMWLSPLVARALAQAAYIPLAVFLMVTLFGLLLRRAMAENRLSKAVTI